MLCKTSPRASVQAPLLPFSPSPSHLISLLLFLVGRPRSGSAPLSFSLPSPCPSFSSSSTYPWVGLERACTGAAHLYAAAAPAKTYADCSVRSDSRVLGADRDCVDGGTTSPGRGQECEARSGRVAGALRPCADAAAEEAPVRTKAGRAGWTTRVYGYIKGGWV
jgi:hypothetical protein